MKQIKRKSALTLFSSALAFACAGAHAQSTGYTGIFGGGPIYKHVASNISEIENSGFTEVVVWSVEVGSTGNLNFNGEFPLTSNGVYVGNNTWPSFAADLVTMKQGTPKRITFSIGSSNVGDWQDIKALVNAQGTGPSSILYKDFQALKQALPSVDAIDFDDENSYDAASTVAFAVMLGNLGYHVEVDPYTNASYWTSVVSQINSQRPGTVDGVHLQTYSGGSGNSPCSGWNFGSVPVYPGVWDADDTPPQAQSTISSWHSQCGITGAFLWLYDDIAGKTYNGQNETAAYASAFNAGLGSSTAQPAVYGIYSDGTSFTTGGLDGDGYAYSAKLLGNAQNWNGSTFTFGAANTANAYSSGTINLTQGQYSELSILATGLNGNQASQTFTVNYTDGTSTVISQSLSDWFTPQNYSGESKAVTMAYRDSSNGTTDNRTFYLYGYAFPIDSTRTVKSVLLPSNRNVAVLSYALSNPATNAVSVDLAPSFNRSIISNDRGALASAGTYSAPLPGSSLEFNDVLYRFGKANAANAVGAAGQTIALPAGQFSTLQWLGAAVSGNQTSQTFTVTYTDGTQSTFAQSISDRSNPQSYAGELQAARLPQRDGNAYLYHYTFHLNPKPVQSIQLPDNTHVQIMAMTLVQ